MDKLKVGIIGFGIMGELYADALAAFDDSLVAGVAEIDPARREQAETRYECPVFESHDAMFREAPMDAVIVALPDFLHREPVLAAAQAGLPMLVEKPFATCTEDAEAMVQAIETAGVRCTIEFSNRWGVQFAQARERVQQGDLGRILSITADLNDTLYVPTEMLSWASRSTPAWFLMSHTGDLVTWITGKRPGRVFAKGTKQLLPARGIDTYDVIEALVEYDDGTTGRLTSGWVLPKGFPLIYEMKMRLLGSEAAIDIDMSDQGMHVFTHDRFEHSIAAMGKVLGRHVGGIYNFLKDFIRDIRQGVQPMVTAQDGLENTRFLVAVHRSLETGEPVDVIR